jgi:hypothetical protein
MQDFRRVWPNAFTLIFSVMALTITATDSFADVKSGLIEGEYRIDSENCRVGQSKPDCRIYFEFRGSVARKLYESMKSEGVADLCTGGQVKTIADGLRCFELGAGDYVCDVGYNFATEKLVSGDMTC